MPEDTVKRDRIAWVDTAKGICIVAVVCLFVTQLIQDPTGSTSWMDSWVTFTQPLRMPCFFLIAGLFLTESITQSWRRYFDKKVVHFFYFFALWTTIYFALTQLFQGLDGRILPGPHAYFKEYLHWYAAPFRMLWFIALLPIYFVVTRLLKIVPRYFVLAAAAFLQVLDVHTGIVLVDHFCAWFVYFYAGYMFAPDIFRFAVWTGENYKKVLFIMLYWILLNQTMVRAEYATAPVISLVLGFSGAAAVIAVSRLLTGWPGLGWIQSLGQRSLAIYLAFYLFIVTTATLLDAAGVITSYSYRHTIAAFVALLGPMLLFRTAQHSPLRVLFERPRWARMRVASRAIRTAWAARAARKAAPLGDRVDGGVEGGAVPG